MGVVHKLTDEIITFIEDQKRENPKLSVRKIANIASETFGKVISKSSVNTILKKANLSSSVGRRSKPEKKFEIPQEKKEQIRKEVQQKAADSPVISEPSDQKQQPSPPEHQEPKKAPAPRPPDIKREEAPAVQESSQAPLKKGAGMIFLLSMMYQLDTYSKVKALIKKNTTNTEITDDGRDLLILSMLRLSGLTATHDIKQFQSLSLWDMVQGDMLKEEALIKNFQAFRPEPQFWVELEHELEQAQTEVLGYQFRCANGNQFYIDSQFQGVWPDQKRPRITAPLHQGIRRLSKAFIVNREELLLSGSAGDKYLSPEMVSFLAFIQAKPEYRVTDIKVFDVYNREVAAFSLVPVKKRRVTFGIYPGQEGFSDLMKSAQWAGRKEIEIPEVQQKLQWIGMQGIGHPLFEEDQFKAFVIWGPDQEEPLMALMTNSGEGSEEETIRNYFLRYNNPINYCISSTYNILENEESAKPLNASVPEGNFVTQENHYGEATIWDVMDALNQALLDAFFQHYRDLFGDKRGDDEVGKFITQICDMEGVVEEESNALKIGIKNFNKASDQEWVPELIRKINQEFISDPWGRRVLIF